MAELAAALRKSVSGFRLPAAASAAVPAAAPRSAETGSHSRLKKLGGS
jgi:hypothetical protein